ncbi:hypothetical protein [Hyalangium minutum]|uniref:Uncharacterized protein n=1 Tax=Hyalangium minutum TaxID=394096 RepID=A0A085WAK3_9BACT|nr:hypothetical protein [Hyalangium minutum]KFE64716.1 hypothetical protein DB31_1734 [Hyalangium minutum]
MRAPQVKALSLEGLEAAEDVEQHFLSEPVAWRQEVLLHVAGFSSGRLIPFSARESLVGHLPNEMAVVDLTLPAKHSRSLRGSGVGRGGRVHPGEEPRRARGPEDPRAQERQRRRLG